MSIVGVQSTVGCGLYGRPKWHAIPTQSINCPTNRALRAAIKAAPTVGMSPQLISDVPEGGGPTNVHRRGGLYGRPKWHVIPTQSPNCPTYRSLRAAIKAAPTVDMSPQLISDAPFGDVELLN